MPRENKHRDSIILLQFLNVLCMNINCAKFDKNLDSVYVIFKGITLIASIDLFTVVCVVTWPLNESEAGVNLVIIQTSLFFLSFF